MDEYIFRNLGIGIFVGKKLSAGRDEISRDNGRRVGIRYTLGNDGCIFRCMKLNQRT